MTSERAVDWTEDEFRALVADHVSSDGDLAATLPRHSAEAVASVRQGIHLWHQSQPTHGVLSQMMLRALEDAKGYYLCAVCQKVL